MTTPSWQAQAWNNSEKKWHPERLAEQEESWVYKHVQHEKKARLKKIFFISGLFLSALVGGFWFFFNSFPVEITNLPVIRPQEDVYKVRIEEDSSLALKERGSIYDELGKNKKEENILLAETEPETPQSKAPVMPQNFIETLSQDPQLEGSEGQMTQEKTPTEYTLPPKTPVLSGAYISDSLKQSLDTHHSQADLLPLAPAETVEKIYAESIEKTENNGAKDEEVPALPQEDLALRNEVEQDFQYLDIPITGSMQENHLKKEATYVVQLAALPREQEALNIWPQIEKKMGSLLLGQKPLIEKADLGEKRGVIYRLQVGPFSLHDAQDLCQKLKKHGAPCFVKRY